MEKDEVSAVSKKGPECSRYFRMDLAVGVEVPSLIDSFAGLLTRVLYSGESIFV